jgi:hypothetical protein
MDLQAWIKHLYWYYLNFISFIQPFGVDIDFNQSVGVDHGADKSGFAKYRVRPEPAFFKAELNPDKIGAALPRSDISA